jgi:hypothetical protein
MVITVSAELEAALNEAARKRGLDPETIAIDILRDHFLASTAAFQPRDEWEQGLLDAARECGVSLSDAALGSEGLYD